MSASHLRYRVLCGFAAVALACGFPKGTLACDSFGPNEGAVDKVQSSWGPAEDLIAKHDYSRALAELEATERYLPLIHDAFIRKCVAQGANLRLVSARAGAAYELRHPKDVTGATSAAHRAWVTFPMSHNCP